jgi:hypothetical protein
MSYTTSLIKEGMKAIREASQDYIPRPTQVDPSNPIKIKSNFVRNDIDTFMPSKPLSQKQIDYANKPLYDPNEYDASYASSQKVNDIILSHGKGRLGRDEMLDIRSINPSDTSNIPSVRAAKGLELLKKLAPKLKSR